MSFKFKLARRLAVSLLLSLGCGLTEAGPVVHRVEAIHVTPARLALQPFQSVDLIVDIVTGHGDPGAVASVKWSATGGSITNFYLLDGVRYVTYQSPAQAGTYYFIVTTVTGAPTDSATISVTTAPVPVYAVAVTPASKTLVAGDTTRLRTTLTDSTGAVIVGRAIEWSSSDAGVATVVSTGQVRAVAPGTATITATVEGRSGTAAITVNP